MPLATCSRMKYFEKKASWELHKNATCCFEQILETVPHKRVAVWPPALHLIKHPSKMNEICWVLLCKHQM